MIENKFNNKIVYAAVLLSCLLLIPGSIFVYKKNTNKEVEQAIQSQGKAPVRTDYKGVLPPLFPSSIPVAKDTLLSQSYAKDYGSLKQSSIVLFSKEEISSVFAFYSSSLVKDGYAISTSSVRDNGSFLVVDKDGSHVEISFVDRTKKPVRNATSTLVSEIKTHIIINAFDRKF